MDSLKQKNIDALAELGFNVLCWEFGCHKLTTRLGKNGLPFRFYVGNDFVLGQYKFVQELEGLKMIEDDIILLMLDEGLPFPEISRCTEPDEGVIYNIGVKGTDAAEVYRTLQRGEIAIQSELFRLPDSYETANEKFELISARFARRMSEILTPIDDIDTYRASLEAREAVRREQLLNQMALLIQAVRENAAVKYGTFIDRIQALSHLVGYEPQRAIENILAGKYNDASPYSK